MSRYLAKRDKPKVKGRKLTVFLIVCICFLSVCLAGSVATVITWAKTAEQASSYAAVFADEEQLTPELDEETGYYTFTTDRALNVMQLTDIHVGGGWMSGAKDRQALDAVATLIKREKPDLVVVTGDIVYPVPFQAGTFNNMSSTKLFVETMESLGVYYAVTFGNHDTEMYSFYNREALSDYYASFNPDGANKGHCLFQAGPSTVDGFGNYVINVKSTAGYITQSLIMLDSHSYTDGDFLGLQWKYDNIHANQVAWYEQEINNLKDYTLDGTLESLCFFHIPFYTFRYAYNKGVVAGWKGDVKYLEGKVDEKDPYVYCGVGEDVALWSKMVELGSTKGVFNGHDHKNNISIEYQGIRLCYGYSIDCLAYSGISKETAYRGCRMITVNPNGTFTTQLKLLVDEAV